MSKLIEEIEERLEGAPRICRIGMQLGLLGFLVALIGAGLLIAEFEFGRYLAFAGIIIGNVGVLAGLSGVFYKSYEDKVDLKEYRKRYENPRQPWE